MDMFYDKTKESVKNAYASMLNPKKTIVEADIKNVDIGGDANLPAPDEGLTGSALDQGTGAALGAPMGDTPPVPPADTLVNPSAALQTTGGMDLPKEEPKPKIKFGPSMKDVRSKVHDVSISLAKIIGTLSAAKMLGPEDMFELRKTLELENEKLAWIMDSTDNLRVK